jgi:CBS domain-containing protein
MTLSKIKSTVSTIRPDTTLREAARLMERDSVGALLISSEVHGPVEGILTDRDIVKEVGRGENPEKTTVSGFFRRPVTMISEDSSRREMTQKMKAHGIRRLPLTDSTGQVTGIVSLDDLLVEISAEMADLGRAVRAEFHREGAGPDVDE